CSESTSALIVPLTFRAIGLKMKRSSGKSLSTQENRGHNSGNISYYHIPGATFHLQANRPKC
ncbi:MAG: hypothetical protein AAFN93_22135, partial [Bacteroidota bacterium]